MLSLLHGVASYLEFSFRENSLGNSRNTREFPGIEGNPGNPRQWREAGTSTPYIAETSTPYIDYMG